MYAKKLKKGISNYIDSMLNGIDVGWAYPVCKRAYDACDFENYYLGNMMHLYLITSDVFGMHAQDTIMKRNISVRPLDQSTVFDILMLKKEGKKTYKINIALVADKLCDDLFLITCWLCADIKTNEWCLSPGAAFLSVTEMLSNANKKKRRTIFELSPEIHKKIFRRDALYTTLPLDEAMYEEDEFEMAESMDWVDSGTDFIIRFLALHPVPGFRTITKKTRGHSYNMIVIPDNQLLGDIKYAHDTSVYPSDEEGLIIDTLSNIADLGDRASEEL